MTNESPSQSHQDMCSKSSELSSGESLSPAPSPEAATDTLKRHRDSSEVDESDASPPPKAPKMAYSIMNILAKDKKDTKANKENSLETHSVSPAPANTANTDTSAQSLNPFFLNPFLAAAAAAAQPGQSNLLHNISNLAMLSKNQSSEMWPWFNMAAMSALYGLDKGYTGLFPSIDNSNLRNLSSNSHTTFAHVNGKSDEQSRLENACQRSNKTVGPNDGSARGRPEVANRCVSHSSSCSVSPSSKYGFDETGKKIESRKLLNRSLDDEDGNRLGFSGASMGDEDDLEDDNEAGDDDEDGSNNGDSFDNMRKKKTRTVFSRNQVFQLESTFDMKRYLSSSERSSLANSLQLTETQIKIWFQNRRNKWKRQLAAEIEANGSNQHQQTQHQLSVSSSSTGIGNQHRNSSNQRIVRVPVLYQSDSQRSFIGQETDHVQSSSSSTHSSLASPSNSSLNSAQTHVNPASLLSPSMLAAAAAASSLYYAAAAHAQPGQFQNFNLNTVTNPTNNSNKQSISSIL